MKVWMRLVLPAIAFLGLGCTRQPSQREIDMDVGLIKTDAELAYMPKLVVRAHHGQTDAEEPGLFGEVKNTGDTEILSARIAVHCLGASGPIHDVYLHVGDLKPGYSEKFGISLAECPSEWTGKVKAEADALLFLDTWEYENTWVYSSALRMARHSVEVGTALR